MNESLGGNWSDVEVDLIVSCYFDMLEQEISGSDYNKSEYRRALLGTINRTPASIERKHQNISAVLDLLGMPWIKGYKPLAKFQNALIEGVERYLTAEGAPLFKYSTISTGRVFEETQLWVGPPPSLRSGEDQKMPSVLRLIRKFDPAGRDARNRELGREGEQLAFQHERSRLKSLGRDDLARKIEWTSEEHGDGAGYDIRSFNQDGSDRFIEVKTTNGAALTPFFLSENERSFSEERPDAFRLLRIYGFHEKPAGFEISPPLENWVHLTPTAYRASF